MEQFANNCNTTVAAGGYTAGSGVLNVVSTAAPWPQVGKFSISIFDAATKALKVILNVTAINSVSQFAVTAEGTDAAANVDDLVKGPMLTARVMKNIGWVLLETKTASNSASLGFAASISALYDEYMIEFVNLVPATNGSKLLIRMSTDGGSNYDSGNNYGWICTYSSSAGPAYAGANSGASAIDMSLGIANGAGNSLVGKMRLFDPLSASLYKIMLGETTVFSTGNEILQGRNVGRYIVTTAVNAVQFLMNSGNITSGTIRVYGLAK